MRYENNSQLANGKEVKMRAGFSDDQKTLEFSVGIYTKLSNTESGGTRFRVEKHETWTIFENAVAYFDKLVLENSPVENHFHFPENATQQECECAMWAGLDKCVSLGLAKYSQEPNGAGVIHKYNFLGETPNIRFSYSDLFNQLEVS